MQTFRRLAIPVKEPEQIFESFEDTPVGQTPAGFSHGYRTPGAFEVYEDGAGVKSLRVTNAQYDNDPRYAYWDAVTPEGVYQVYTRMRGYTFDDTSSFGSSGSGVVIAGGYDPVTGEDVTWDVVWRSDNRGLFRLHKRTVNSSGVSTTLLDGVEYQYSPYSYALDWDPNTSWGNIRAEVDGPIVRARFWPDGVEEPVNDWHIEFNVGEYLPPKAGLIQYPSRSSIFADILSLGTNGAEAPTQTTTYVDAASAPTFAATLSGRANKAIPAAASLTAQSSVSANAGRTVSAATSATGTGTLSATTSVAASAAVAAVWASSLAAAPIVVSGANASFTSEAQLQAQASAAASASSTLTGQSTLASAVQVQKPGQASLTGQTQLQAAGAVDVSTQSAFVGQTTFSAVGTTAATGAVDATLSTSATFSAAPAATYAGASGFTATAGTSATPAVTYAGAGDLTVAGALTAQTSLAVGVSTSFTVGTQLVADAQTAVFAPATAAMDASGGLSATGSLVRAGAATLPMSTSFTVEGARDVSLSAEFPFWELSLVADTVGGESVFAGFLYAHDVVVRPALEPTRCDLR